MSDLSLSARWRSWAPYSLSLLRIVAAFLFMQHGTSKLFAFPAPIMPGAGAVPLMSQMGAAGVLETFGGFLLLIGLFTRPIAFLIAGEMAVAYFQAHAGTSFWPLINQGELAIFYCFLWLYVSAAGPGAWSLDALWHRGAARKMFDASAPAEGTPLIGLRERPVR